MNRKCHSKGLSKFDVFGFYFQTMNDVKAMKIRLAKYLIPVLVMSLTFNIPKFFESKLTYKDYSNESTNVTLVKSPSICIY